MKEKDKKRFEKYFTKGKKNECWVWFGHTAENGYGTFRMPDKNWISSRFAYVLKHGKIPKNKLVCHSCDNKLCVNPHHLWIGTHSDNMQDMLRKGRGNFAKGEIHCCSKLSDKQVKEIRSLFAQQKMNQVDLGKKFKVTQSNISRIVNLFTRIL